MMQKIAPALLSWFQQHRRDMPWRVTQGEAPNPYHVFLSEMMLQQTTSATVTDYFIRFIARWPTLEQLARADLEEVLHLWSGLGYYSRARFLHESAQRIRREFSGALPNSVTKLKSLRGVGDYTACAIAAFVFNQPAVAIDGNIRRVAARLFCVEKKAPDKYYAEKLLPLMPQAGDSPYPQTRHGDMIQGLMELGSLICKPQKPKCAECPICFACLGQDIAAQLPVKAAKIKPKIQHCLAFIICNPRGQILLEKRPLKGLLGGMTGFPLGRFHEGKAEFLQNPLSLGENVLHHDLPPLPIVHPQMLDSLPISHVFTHIRLTVFLAKAVSQGDDDAFLRESAAHGQYFWANWEDIVNYPLPRLMKKIHHGVNPQAIK